MINDVYPNNLLYISILHSDPNFYLHLLGEISYKEELLLGKRWRKGCHYRNANDLQWVSIARLAHKTHGNVVGTYRSIACT